MSRFVQQILPSTLWKRLRPLLPNTPLLPVVRLQGVIGMVTPLRPGLTLANCARQLEIAFSIKRAPAVALLINSPGGSPVQSHLIYQRIRSLAEENEKQVLVFIEDVAASGGYLIALAGDTITADPASLVGSIGVLSSGFGFVQTLEKLGIERRLHTAGARKALLDPFQPEKEEDVAHLEEIQKEVHAHFITLVRQRRNSALHEDEDVFSGLFWTGARAKSLGLIDQLGDLRSVARERFGEDVVLKPIHPERGWLLGRREAHEVCLPKAGFSHLPKEVLSTLEERALWARFGF